MEEMETPIGSWEITKNVAINLKPFPYFVKWIFLIYFGSVGLVNHSQQVKASGI